MLKEELRCEEGAGWRTWEGWGQALRGECQVIYSFGGRWMWHAGSRGEENKLLELWNWRGSKWQRVVNKTFCRPTQQDGAQTRVLLQQNVGPETRTQHNFILKAKERRWCWDQACLRVCFCDARCRFPLGHMCCLVLSNEKSRCRLSPRGRKSLFTHIWPCFWLWFMCCCCFSPHSRLFGNRWVVAVVIFDIVHSDVSARSCLVYKCCAGVETMITAKSLDKDSNYQIPLKCFFFLLYLLIY